MAVYKCKFIEAHSPVFFNGKNFGTKLKASSDLDLYWDKDFDKTYFYAKGCDEPCIMGTYHVLHPLDFGDLPGAPVKKLKPGPKPKAA